MPANSGPFALTLNTLQPVPNPSATFSTPAAKVQIQNASPFILNVTVDGAVQVLQSFTAQTFDTDSSGSPLTLLPTTGPAGTQGTATIVWLQPGETPAMADGQLTGAAQYAVGLGTTLFGPTVLNGSGAGVIFNLPPIPPTTRTLVVKARRITSGSQNLQCQVVDLTVPGNSFFYYNSFMYLGYTGGISAGGGFPGGALFSVVPLMPLISAAGVQMAFNYGAGVQYEITVFADTLQYDESVFYNGSAVGFGTTATGSGTVTILTGPARLLSASIEATGGGTALFNLPGGTILRSENISGTSTSTSSHSFPPNTIIQPGQTVTATFVSAGSVVSALGSAAYP